MLDDFTNLNEVIGNKTIPIKNSKFTACNTFNVSNIAGIIWLATKYFQTVSYTNFSSRSIIAKF